MHWAHAPCGCCYDIEIYLSIYVKALVGAFNQEKALVGAFSVIVKTSCGTDGSICGSVLTCQLGNVLHMTYDNSYKLQAVTCNNHIFIDVMVANNVLSNFVY